VKKGYYSYHLWCIITEFMISTWVRNYILFIFQLPKWVKLLTLFILFYISIVTQIHSV